MPLSRITSLKEEQELVARAPERDELVALLWSGKESALKALREGLRLDTERSRYANEHAKERRTHCQRLEPAGGSVH